MSVFGAAKKGLGLLGKKKKSGWGAHLKRRSRVFKEGQKRHKALDIKEGKKYHGPHSYQLTDPARKVRTRKFAGALVRGAKNIVKHTPWRKELAGLKKTHRTKQKILGARAGRAKQAKQAAGTAKFYARHPEAKTMFAKQKFGRQFRKAGKI